MINITVKYVQDDFGRYSIECADKYTPLLYPYSPITSQ